MKTSIVERAMELALTMHEGKHDLAGKPYILHPLRVAAKMETDIEIATALLHDVVEEAQTYLYCNFDLRGSGFPDVVYEAVMTLTRKKDQSYGDYVRLIAKDPLATKIKIADIEDNMNMLRLPCLNGRHIKRLIKYHSAYSILKGTNNANS